MKSRSKKVIEGTLCFLDVSIDDWLDTGNLMTAEFKDYLYDVYDSCSMALGPDNRLECMPNMSRTIETADSYIKSRYSVQLISFIEVKMRTHGVYIDSIIKYKPDATLAKELRYKFENHGEFIRADIIFKDFRRKKYRASAYLDLKTGIFAVSDCIKTKTTPVRLQVLDEYLTPMLSKAQMESYALSVLDRYYPEASYGMRINPEMLAACLGLRIIRTGMSNGIEGRLLLDETEMELSDMYGKSYTERVPGGTILVDFKNKGRSYTNAVIHECCHFLLHHDFYLLQKLYCFDLNMIPEWDTDQAIREIELQAEHLVPRLLMPWNSVSEKAQDLMVRYAYLPYKQALAKTIYEISEFYEVSKSSARIRLIELGYKEAKGIMTYKDNHYIPGFIDTSGFGHEYSISSDEGLKLYLNDRHFRSIINTGRFCFAENHYCLNNEKYLINGKDGRPQLTEYARTHISECCILFEVKHGDKQYRYDAGVFNSEQIYRGPDIYRPVDVPGEQIPEAGKIRYLNYINAKRNLFPNFGDTLAFHIKERGFTQEIIAEMINVSDRQIRKYMTGEVKNPVKRTMIAMCIALQLEGDLSDDLLSKAGCHLAVSEDDLILSYIIHTMYRYSIPYCNDYLADHNCSPLTKPFVA